MDDAKAKAKARQRRGGGTAAVAPERSDAGNAVATQLSAPKPASHQYIAFWSTASASSSSSRPILSHSLTCSAILFLSATRTLPLIQSSIVQPFLSALSMFLLRVTFVVTATLSFLHRTGALRRYALKFAEDELSKNLNGALITLSDIQVDVWRGRVVAQDLIIHNKDRDDWEWDSPCLARVGRVEVTLNFASVIQLPKIGRILNHTFFDIYTVLGEDIQVFVEKRKNVFNFHLLDPSLDIPEYRKLKMKKRKHDPGSVGGGLISSLALSKSSSLEREEERGDLVSAREVEVPFREEEEEANKIVEKLVGAVSKIGKAANEGGTRGLQSALRNQKDSVVQNLKQLHTQGSRTGASVSRREDSWKSKKEQGVSVIRELGRVVEKNVSDIKNQVAFLQKPPGRKPGWEPMPPDYVRVGSILFREARIFTKDILMTKGGGGDDAVRAASSLVRERSGHGQEEGGSSGGSSGWARPIVIFELAVTGAELCPPMSARDPTTGMPVVGISVDRLLDIILKRIMAEAAKSNTGRLFQTAFGEVFSFVGDNVSSGKD